MSKHKPLTIVNEHDEVVGPGELVAANEQKLFRRSVDIYMFNQDGKMLLQTRGPHISWPGLLDKAAGGYVDFGDEYAETAYRELHEELGITGIALKLLGAPVRQGLTYTALFTALLPKDMAVTPDKEEVADVSWWSADDLETQMIKTPELFIPNFVTTMKAYGDLIWAASGTR